MSPGKRAAAAVFVVLGYFALQSFLQSRAFEASRSSSVTAYNPSGAGVSAFREFAADSASVKRSPILAGEELDGKNGFVLLSPFVAPSAAEARHLARFVASGGTLVAGFHDLESWARIRAALAAFLLVDFRVDSNPAFRNHEIQTATLRGMQDTRLLARGERYSFYSSVQIDGPGCAPAENDPGAECFVRSVPYFQGEIVLVAGLPYFSNGLIWRGDNRNATLRLIERAKPLIVDEHGHFYTDQSWVDLAKKRDVALPIAVLGAGLLLVLLFARPSSQQSPTEEAAPPVSYHAAQARVLSELFRNSRGFQSAIGLQRDFLLRRFRRDRAEIERSGAKAISELARERAHPSHLFRVARELVRLHQELQARYRGARR